MRAKTGSKARDFRSTQSAKVSGQKRTAPEQIGERLGEPVLGDELLHVEIDRRRPQALAIWRRRAHPGRERRPRLAAAMDAGVDHGLVLRHLDPPLGEVEHLASLRAGLHRSRERSAAVTARLRLAPNNPVGRRRPAQRVALVPRLPAARLARTAAKAAGNARLLPQPIARWRLGARRAVLIQAPAKLGVLRPQRRVLASQIRDLAPKPLDQIANLGRENHPNLDSHFPPARLAKSVST